MPKTNHTEIICIIDRSGSMDIIRNDAIGGFNTFLESQKKLPGTASISLVLFDHEYLNPIKNQDIQSVEPLTDKTFVPRGGTALLDAIGRTLNEVGARLGSTPESDRPEKVMVCILTDGQENSSQEFSRPKIKEMIEHQREKYKWEFCFLAANQDAFAEAVNIGIDRCKTASFVADSQGTARAYASMNAITTSYRSGA